MRYPEIGDMVTVVLEDAIVESGIVEGWGIDWMGTDWIELREPNTNSISCIKQKYIVGFKIIDTQTANIGSGNGGAATIIGGRSYSATGGAVTITSGIAEDEDKPISIKGIKAEQLNYTINPLQDNKSQALKTTEAHLNRINSERKNVEKHFKKIELLRKYPTNYDSPDFLKIKKA